MTSRESLQAAFAILERGGPTKPLPRVAPRNAQLTQVLKRLHVLRMEGISLYQSLPHLQCVHECRTKWCIVDGANRSGKSLTASAEDCRAWLGCDPFDKYPRRNGNSLVVGQELDDIARLWRTCAESSFKMISDQHTGLCRAVRPDPNDPSHLDPYDNAYREKWKDAPPLIPPRMIASIAWENKSKRQPRLVTFSTGWRVHWRSSKGDSPQGDHYHHVHFDEQLDNEDFYKEANRGLVQLASDCPYLPRGIWSATSQTNNIQLDELRSDAVAGASYVSAYKTTIDQNPYVTDEAKREFLESLDEDERAVRYYGENAIMRRRIYGIYDPQGIHGCEPFAIPPNWCRFLALDPGTDHCATTFYAVDPEDQHVYLYDSIDLRNAFSEDWAAEIKRRQGDNRFEAWVIDQQMGQQRTANANERTAERFFNAAKKLNVRPRSQGTWNGFFPGSNDISAREDSLLEMMNIRGTGPFEGTPRLQVFRDVSPELNKQIKRACNDSKNLNKRFKRKHIPSDLLETLEYMAAFDPRYHEPETLKNKKQCTVWDSLNQKKAKQKQRRRQKEQNSL